MSLTCPTLEPHHTKTALYFRRCPLPKVAAAAGVSVRHLNYVIAGQRPVSRKVAAALRDALGEHGWNFAIGKVDVLHAEPAEGVPHAVE